MSDTDPVVVASATDAVPVVEVKRIDLGEDEETTVVLLPGKLYLRPCCERKRKRPRGLILLLFPAVSEAFVALAVLFLPCPDSVACTERKGASSLSRKRKREEKRAPRASRAVVPAAGAGAGAGAGASSAGAESKRAPAFREKPEEEFGDGDAFDQRERNKRRRLGIDKAEAKRYKDAGGSDEEDEDQAPDPLFDNFEDDKNEKWAAKHKARVSGGGAGSGRKSDATLSCPCCFTNLCFDCQKHAQFDNQFRAMFVHGCATTADAVKPIKGADPKQK
jgi:hypothetical protein